MIATSSFANHGDLSWKDVSGGSASGSFGNDSISAARRMRGVMGDGEGNWMIVGLRARAFRSDDNGLTFTKMYNMPDNTNGQTWENTDLHCVRYAKVGTDDVWMVGGEDGYLAVSTDFGDNWTAIENPWSQGGTGVNHTVKEIAFSAVQNWPGTS